MYVHVHTYVPICCVMYVHVCICCVRCVHCMYCVRMCMYIRTYIPICCVVHVHTYVHAYLSCGVHTNHLSDIFVQHGFI